MTLITLHYVMKQALDIYYNPKVMSGFEIGTSIAFRPQNQWAGHTTCVFKRSVVLFDRECVGSTAKADCENFRLRIPVAVPARVVIVYLVQPRSIAASMQSKLRTFVLRHARECMRVYIMSRINVFKLYT